MSALFAAATMSASKAFTLPYCILYLQFQSILMLETFILLKQSNQIYVLDTILFWIVTIFKKGMLHYQL